MERSMRRIAFLYCVAFMALFVIATNLPTFAACTNCGTVVELKAIKKEGEATGAGAVLGGIAGGVIGHQVGHGRGRDVATVAGAAGGAYVGHQVEKSRNASVRYQVIVKMEDGATRFFSFRDPTSYRIGDRVKIVDRKLVRQ